MWFSVVTACLSVLFKQSRQFYFLLIFFFFLTFCSLDHSGDIFPKSDIRC